MASVGGGPLQPSKLLPLQEETGPYEPAPLTAASLWNGVAKYCHPQRCLNPEFLPFAKNYLNWLFPLASGRGLETLEECETLLQTAEHGGKSAGLPWKHLGAVSKLQALKKFGIRLDSSMHVMLGTLKDELRPKGKDARFFRFPGLHDYIEGFLLFSKVNHYLEDALFTSPMFVKYITPGPDLTTAYRLLESFGGDKYDYDGPSWDANVPLALVEIICDWRCSLDPDNAERIRDYYIHMYNGYTMAGGHVFHLVGQPSGHTNTTVDNSLVNILAMLYGAFKLDWSYKEFHERVLYFVCGDDLIWSDKSGVYNAQFLVDSRYELGIYSELHSLSPLSLKQCHFVGTQPIYYDGQLSYTYSFDKLSSSMRWTKKSRTVRDQLAKLVSLYQLVVHCPDSEVVRKFAYDYALRNAQHLDLSSTDTRGYLTYLQDKNLSLRLYTRYEGDLKLQPFKNGVDRSACGGSG